jgi:DNA-binding NtrC family response regulator
LKNVLESAVVMSQDDTLQAGDFSADLFDAPAAQTDGRGQTDFLAAGDYREAKRKFEIAFIKAKLRGHGGNITRTAASIGLHRQSLQEKLREL